MGSGSIFPKPLPAACEGLREHVKKYWKYDNQKKYYIYSTNEENLEIYEKCIIENFDTTKLFKLLGQPTLKEINLCGYCLNYSCANERKNKMKEYSVRFNKNGHITFFKYSYTEWIY
jgi:outer membrane protein assembly factor BamE (lipoprotein component of BamABCDE complex)